MSVSSPPRTPMSRGLLAPERLARPLREEFLDRCRSPDSSRAPGAPG
ncbi:hypothetical protein [Streptomyces sennicomposti]